MITPKQGESYYAKENYYSAEESVENSQWFGEGAKQLGLKGKVKPKQFKRLLYGELPNGTRFRTQKQQKKGRQEIAGLDCTFSAPKSASVIALVEGDLRVEQAHKRAVRRTLKIIERDYAATRARVDGEVKTFYTNNLIVGQFHHDTSRELDPHLHTHCVILNMTHHNNRYYAFKNNDVHKHKKMLGMIYQNELALEVQKLGYEIEQKGHGQFEIKGFSEEQLKSFSKRRQQIQAKLGDDSTWSEREQAWDKTRIKKGEPIPREELQAYWRKELSDLPFPQPKLEGDKEQINPDELETANVRRALNEAIEHFSERQVAFKPEDLKQFILTEAGKYSHSKVAQAIAKSNELIHLDKLVTTQTALMREIATIRLVKDGQDRVPTISHPEVVKDTLAELSLTEGQRNAVTLAATTSDQIIAWQGVAGAGKTYALSEFKKIAEAQGYTIKGFAPSAKAAGVLSQEMGIQTTTVARKLVSQALDEEVEQQQIWIVDEAGLLGASDAHELLKKAKAEKARVLLVGDTRQLSSVAAGNPFKSLQKAGIATAYLDQSLRQKTKDLKKAVDLLSDGKVAQGIKILETNKRIEEIADGDQRANRMAQDYLKLNPDERKQTLVIAGTHKERGAILDSIRTGLKAEGTLGESVGIKRLKSKSLTNTQKNYAHYYEVGNVVIPLAYYKRTGLEKNQQYIVQAVEGDSLVLTDSAGESKRVSPAHFKYKEVYEALDTDIAVGDRLRWGKNDKQLNRVNGQEFVVTQIENNVATIATETGRIEQIDLERTQHLDHALVSTTYSSQGLTSNQVLVSVSNNLTLSQESFYVAASRAKYNLRFYVEDRESLIKNASTSRAQLNPLELIREHQRQVAVAVASRPEPEFKSDPPKQSPTPSPKKAKPTLKSEQEVIGNEPKPDSVSQPKQSPQKPKPIIKSEKELNNSNETELDITPDPSLPANSTEEQPDITRPVSSQEPSITTPSPEPQPQPQTQSQEIPAPQDYRDVRDNIMENLNSKNIPSSEQLKMDTVKVSTQIQELEKRTRLNKKQQYQKDYLNKKLLNIQAFTNFSVGQQVSLNQINGTITDLKLSSGGMPEAWVKWDNSRVPISEQPRRLTLLHNQLNHESISNSPQSQPNTDRDPNSNPKTNTRETTRHRLPIEASGGDHALEGRTEQSTGQDREPIRPTPQNIGGEIPPIPKYIEPNLIRANKSQRQFNRSRDSLKHQQPEHQRNNQQFSRANGEFKLSSEEYERIKQQYRALAAQLRVTPVIEVAERLGLRQDKQDRNKYRDDAHIIVFEKDQPKFYLNDPKIVRRFYDHLNLKGGGGAIDLVMQVNGSNFRDAIDWLNGSTISFTPSISKQSTQPRNIKPEVKKEPFTAPAPNESKWLAVKEYLVAKRGLPIYIVNELHHNRTVYADDKQNAVFIRKNLDDKVTGASLRGTYNDSKFKGLAKGTERSAGWFTYIHGTGEPERIVLTESPIDSLSAAAVSQKPETTLFISTDGSGSIPESYLQQQLEQGKQILVAYDNDQAGETMAQKVLEKLPGAVRVKPTIGKDWNEQLVKSQIQDLAQTVQKVLNEHGQLSLTDDSVSFEGNKFIFNSDGNKLNIYSKSREKVVFEINSAKNSVFNDLSLSEKQILERFKYNRAIQEQQQQRGIDFSR